jgi:hypothetical protein
MRAVLSFLLTLVTIAASAADPPCIVESTNHGGGRFSYTFRRGIIPYVWGIDTNYGFIQIQSYGVLEVQNPPAWNHAVSPSGVITWTVTNGLVFLDDPITFSVRSCLTEAATYMGYGPNADTGFLTGVAYQLPNYTEIIGGYQNFVFIGPALPRLTVERIGTNVTVLWSTEASGLSLEATERLDAMASWMPITNVPVTQVSNFVVTLPATNSAKFFRLVTPCSP